MAEPRMETVLTMILVASLWAGAMAQSSCTNVIISMSPCLNYITGNSSTPSSGCCTQLASVVRSQPQCLCEVLNGGGSSLGIQINQTQALALPTACSVQTPPISRCNASSPADSPAGTPNSGSRSKTVPATNGDSSDGTSIKSPFSLTSFLVFFASCAATFTSI
ncbi:non-specific lipid transfer protein GPI-anchored 5 [Vitis vinifera]|uniref:Bifunctional inhibitor/plant lipid transfer protein/seed storage helical domain-containing protein n=1 Tax=Vitis vinifera TaxID=29760 RepID=D7TDZ0_VITVI|eukprot:XP_003632312.1 PREDICTED: non-specific lipid-transfer protein-like protein At2g13820 [Vitis vinifera]